MKFSEAFELMKQGEKIKLPSWVGYWYWSKKKQTIIIHMKDGFEFDIRKTTNPDDTFSNIASEDWEIFHKYKVMISQPMANKTDEEIKTTREKAIKFLVSQGYEIVNTLFDGDWFSDEAMEDRGVVNVPLCYLSKSLESMSQCDAVYFCKGWLDARGCQIENSVASAYGLKIIYEEYEGLMIFDRKKSYSCKEISKAKGLLLKMRDNCVKKDSDAYDDPEREEKQKALDIALEGFKRLPIYFGIGE